MSVNWIRCSPNWIFSKGFAFQPFVAPVSTILRPEAGIKLEMSSFGGYKCNISQSLNLCNIIYSIVNKTLAHVTWKFFSFHFIQM